MSTVLLGSFKNIHFWCNVQSLRKFVYHPLCVYTSEAVLEIKTTSNKMLPPFTTEASLSVQMPWHADAPWKPCHMAAVLLSSHLQFSANVRHSCFFFLIFHQAISTDPKSYVQHDMSQICWGCQVCRGLWLRIMPHQVLKNCYHFHHRTIMTYRKNSLLLKCNYSSILTLNLFSLKVSIPARY